MPTLSGSTPTGGGPPSAGVAPATRSARAATSSGRERAGSGRATWITWAEPPTTARPGTNCGIARRMSPNWA